MEYCHLRDWWRFQKKNPRKRRLRNAFRAMVIESECEWDCSDNYDPDRFKPMAEADQPWYHHSDRYHRHDCFMAWIRGEPLPAEEGYDDTRDHCHYLWRTGQL